MKITPIELKGNDDRGYTAEYQHDRGGKQLIIFRKTGTVSGRHYHKGLSATKDPEILVLLNGTCKFSWKHIDATEVETATLAAPVKLEIPKLIWHELIPETDCVFIELNSVEEHAADTFHLP